ncbi:MAG: 1-deoxy-D-xylulose-5-phosphate reductoisomerase [Bacillota bacterium]|nr:1-deoxy-D-xylulose-5-phosphate reductoisomerase [Bacillota bacterium]
MVQNISILGSTGSIGVQALEVARKLNLSVCALTANNNIELLEEQIREFKPEIAVVFEETKAKELKQKISDTNTKVLCGMDGLIEAATISQADLILNSVVGMVGLQPTLAAAENKKNIALANKETLVAGGSLVMDAVKRNNVKLYPVDSEHSAIFQCLQGAPDEKALKKIILTASGGPFFGKKADDLVNIKKEQALKHPNWSMGAKITIDSATMMNKGLEIIEACWLFNVPASQIEVVVHRESIIHSMVEFTDNSVIAQLSLPDMRIPIQYAITYPKRLESPVPELDITKIGTFSFYKPDEETFLCLKACKEAIEIGGAAPVAANGANEEANRLFLQEKISFLNIGELVYEAMKAQKGCKIENLQDILTADKKARQYVLDAVK